MEVGLVTEDGYPHKGILDFFDNRVDPTTGTLKVRGRISQPENPLVGGLFVRVRVTTGRLDRPCSWPSALGIDQGQRFVYVIDQDNKVQYKAVTAGASQGGLRRVESDLPADAWIVVNGVQRVRPGIVAAPQRAAMTDFVAAPAAAAGAGQRAQRRRSAEAARLAERRQHVRPLLHRPADLRHGHLDRHRHRRAGGADRPADRAVSGGHAADGSVTAIYPGASAKVVADTVAAPIEQEVNGVENMLYMSPSAPTTALIHSTSPSSWAPISTWPRCSCRTAWPSPRPSCPRRSSGRASRQEEVAQHPARRQPDLARTTRYDQLYLSNYATIQVKDELARAARRWRREAPRRPRLQHAGLARPGEAGRAQHDRRRRGQARSSEQNVQVAAGRIGQPPVPAGSDFQFTINTLGRLLEPEQFGDIIVKTGARRPRSRGSRDVGRVELGRQELRRQQLPRRQAASTLAIFQLPGSNALDTAEAVRRRDGAN